MASKFPKFLFGLALLAAATGVAYLLFNNPPKSEREKPELPILSVEVALAAAQPYQFVIESYGTVQARTRGALTSQVAGRVINVSEQFRQGSFFEGGDLLLEIDPSDYQAALASATASVSQAQASLAQEQSQAEQATRDWQRLGNKGAIPDLVARKPQLAAAKAQLESSRAAVKQAELNLSRTKIKAPYAGRIINKNVDLGEHVMVGASLAEIFAIDYVEVALPLSSREYAQIEIQENYRGESIKVDPDSATKVNIISQIGERQNVYQGFLSRSAGTYDTATRQTNVIVQIDDPYGKRDDDTPPLKIGQFVTAQIKGREINDVYVIPNRAVYQGSYVFVVADEMIVRRDVNVIWQDQSHSIISQGIEDGEMIVLTPLNEAISGTRVEIKQP